MIVGLGIDLVPIDRFERMLDRYGDRVAHRLFTEGERADCQGRAHLAQHYAARFAVKECVLKALAVPEGLRWHEMEVRSQPSGEPRLHLHGEAAAAAARRGADRWHVSMTHAGGMAVAVVVLEAASSLQVLAGTDGRRTP